MVADRREPDLVATSAKPHQWWDWLSYLATRGQERLGRTGLILVLGLVLGIGSLIVFGKLADEVLDQETMRLDNAVLNGLRQFGSPTLTAVSRVLSALGAEILAVFLVILAISLAWQRRWLAVVELLLITFGAQLLNTLLKDLFQRTRPAPLEGPLGSVFAAQAFSFPSGHAMVSAAFYLFVAYLSWRILRGRLRLVVVAGLLTLIGLIGVSRLYLGVHFFTDVVAGYLTGFIWTDAVIIAGRVLSRPARGRPHGTDSSAVVTPQEAAAAAHGSPAVPERPDRSERDDRTGLELPA